MDYFNLIALKGKITTSGWISQLQNGTTLINFTVEIVHDDQEPLLLDVLVSNPIIVEHLEKNQNEIRINSIIGLKGELRRLKYKKHPDINIEYRVVIGKNENHKFVYMGKEEIDKKKCELA